MSFQQPYEQQSRRRRNAIFQPNYTIENPLSQIDRRGRGNTAQSFRRPNFSFINKQLYRKNKNRPPSSNDVPNERLSDIEERASYENYEDYGEGGSADENYGDYGEGGSADDNLPIIPNIPLGTGGGQQPRRQSNSTIENPVSQIDRRRRGMMFSAVDQTLLNQPFIREQLIRGRRAVEAEVNEDEGYTGGPNIPLGTGGGQQPRRQSNSTIENPVSQIDRRRRGMMFSAVDQTSNSTLLNQPFIREPLIRGRRAVEAEVNEDEGYTGGDENHLTYNTLFSRASPQPTIAYHIEDQFGEHSIHNSAPIAHHRVLPSYPISDEVYFGHKT